MPKASFNKLFGAVGESIPMFDARRLPLNRGLVEVISLLVAPGTPMTSQKRKIVAYLACKIISGKSPCGVCDRASASWTQVSGVASPNHLSLYDHDRACMVSVVGPPENLYVYDGGSGRHIQMKISGCHFSGYDFETQAFFDGSVNGTSIFFCDFQHSDYFKYSTEPPPRPSRPTSAMSKQRL